MLCTYLYVNITNKINNKINNKRGEGEGGHIVSPLPSLPPPPPWCSRWCWRYHWCWRCACAHPPSHAHALPHACALPLMRLPSLSCAHPPSRALALPRVQPPSPLHLVHPPSLSCTHPSFHAPAFPLVLVHPPTLSFSCACLPSRSHCRVGGVVLLLQLPLLSLLALMQLQQQLLLLPCTRACSFLCACWSSGLCASAPCLSFLLSVHQYL